MPLQPLEETNENNTINDIPQGINDFEMDYFTSLDGLLERGETLFGVRVKVEYGGVRLLAIDWPGAPFVPIILRGEGDPNQVPNDVDEKVYTFVDGGIAIPAGAKLRIIGANLGDGNGGSQQTHSELLVKMIVQRESAV